MVLQFFFPIVFPKNHPSIFMNLEVVSLYVNFPGEKTFAYDLHLHCCRDRWKGLTKEEDSEKGIHHAFRYSVPKM